MEKYRLTMLEKEFSIHRFDVEEPIPGKIFAGKYYWIGKTEEELSVVCDSDILLDSKRSDNGWSILKVDSKLDFSMVGILADIANILAKGGISIIALSTFDTDYIMLKTEKSELAKKLLNQAEYFI
jgi:hypothetical protein